MPNVQSVNIKNFSLNVGLQMNSERALALQNQCKSKYLKRILILFISCTFFLYFTRRRMQVRHFRKRVQLHHASKIKVSELIYDRQSVGQYVLVSGAHLGPVANFSFTLKFLLDINGFVSL
jgi:hypothetical protein